MSEFSPYDIFVWTIIVLNVLISYIGFSNQSFFDKYKFHVGAILHNKEYIRLLSSAFLHGSWMHLAFNMYAFWSFCGIMPLFISVELLVLVYFVSLFAGNFLSLFFHKNEPEYSAIGASGAVSGVVFASIMFYPFGQIIIVFLPMFPISSWVFGIAYLLYTVFGMSRSGGKIGHEAHMGGALAGLVIAAAVRPDLAMATPVISVILLVIPLLMFFVKPKGQDSSFKFNVQNDRKSNNARTKRSVDDLYYNEEFEREKELNLLLERVEEFGIESLSLVDKKRLEFLSKTVK